MNLFSKYYAKILKKNCGFSKKQLIIFFSWYIILGYNNKLIQRDMIKLKKIRNIMAILACKVLTFVGRLAGKKATSAPGAIALRISPSILRDLASQLKGPVVMVCGTNGKTTTNNLLCSLFEAQGQRVVCNNVGANMLPGVAWAFISKASVFGKLKADCAAIECDEASLRRVVPHVKPDKVVITNLFRDQLDRYGEIDITVSLLNEALDTLPDVQLILNGDDPLSARFGKGKKCIYYGVDDNCNVSVKETKEGRFCPECGAELGYNYYHYSQLGDYYCPSCGFKRPAHDYAVRNVSLTNGMSFDVCFGNTTLPLKLNYRGFYNIYNVVASLCAYTESGFELNGINDVFDAYKPQIARMEPFVVNGKTVILNLSKNPAGFNQAISTLLADKSSKDVMIAINDGAGDGKDVSWLWDVDFEQLKNAGLTSLTASGIRKYDLAVRLKYAGFENFDVSDNNAQTLKKVIGGNGDVAYILINYTAMFETQNNLKAMSDAEEVNNK